MLDQKLGMGLLILMVIQVILGSVAHWVKRSIKSLQASSGRGPTHFLHMGLGVITIVVGWVTVWFGEQNVPCLFGTASWVCTNEVIPRY